VSFRLERLLGERDLAEALRREAREGLTATPKRMRSRWVWDARGSELFERITALPDYYLTRAERSALEAHAAEIAALARPETLVELGSGSSAKTAILLDVLPELRRFVALDVSETALAAAGPRLADAYPSLEIVGVVGDFERHLAAVPARGRTLVACLGSTIGALEPAERASLLAAAAALVAPDGALLLGIDLLKPVERIVAAYRDADGLSDALIANLLPILARELGAGLDPARVRSEAVWNAGLERMEMFVRALESQTVPVPALGITVCFARGETLRTEISTKFRRTAVELELAAAGLATAGWWNDAAGDGALCLARRTGVGRRF
jgi:L-histidine N-alpha-methyltransferase